MPKAQTRTLLREGDGGLVRRTTLQGGLRVITEQVPGVRSVAFGVWVNVGSRDETGTQMGSAHYLEHLLFKGTRKRSAMEISSSIEAVGGDLNAFPCHRVGCWPGCLDSPCQRPCGHRKQSRSLSCSLLLKCATAFLSQACA